MICPNCNVEGKLINENLYLCEICKFLFMGNKRIKIYESNGNEDKIKELYTNLPVFEHNQIIICCDIRSPLFAEYGRVIKQEDLFIKVHFNNGKILWIDKKCVSNVPWLY